MYLRDREWGGRPALRELRAAASGVMLDIEPSRADVALIGAHEIAWDHDEWRRRFGGTSVVVAWNALMMRIAARQPASSNVLPFRPKA